MCLSFYYQIDFNILSTEDSHNQCIQYNGTNSLHAGRQETVWAGPTEAE